MVHQQSAPVAQAAPDPRKAHWANVAAGLVIFKARVAVGQQAPQTKEVAL